MEKEFHLPDPLQNLKQKVEFMEFKYNKKLKILVESPMFKH